MARVNQGKYRIYRRKFAEIQDRYREYINTYRGKHRELDLNLDIFINISGSDVKEEINYIKDSANNLERSLYEMLHGDKFELKEKESEYIEMKNELLLINRELEIDLDILSEAISGGYYYED